MNIQEAQEAMRAAGKTGPAVMIEKLADKIVDVQWYVFPGTAHTVCCIKAKNEHTFIGDAASASPENFVEQIGRNRALERALEKMIAAEAYLIAEDRVRPLLPAED